MNTLYQAFTATQGRTHNGAVTRTASLSPCVDLFFMAGSMRGKDIVPSFAAALADNPEHALRIVQWMRDIRGGAGERQLYRDVLKYLEQTESEALVPLIMKTHVIGRWDDLLVFETDKYKSIAADIIMCGLQDESTAGLCAKWMPRKGEKAEFLRKHIGATPRQWRKLLVERTNVVETKMCAKQWDEIDFSKLPSLASSRYANAFRRNTENYEKYLDALEKGETKINAGAVYPYDIVNNVMNGQKRTANEQWKALPNYMEGSDERILPLVDVSGSMGWLGGRGWDGLPQPIDVAVSLGIYLAERNEGIFKDVYMTFSDAPKLCVLPNGTLEQRMTSLSKADWGMSTNIQNAFMQLLNVAQKNSVPQSEMPSTILILSDMEFNTSYGVKGRSVSAFDAARQMYEAAGYEMPKLVFWNLNGRPDNIPVKYDETGTAMVSGFSPAIMKSILGAEEFTPESIMLDTIMNERYEL